MQKLLYAIFGVVLIGALSIVSAQTQIQAGRYSVNANSSGYTLDKSSGDRTYTVEVVFTKPFESRPQVVVTVSTVDAEKTTNVRYSVEATAVSRDGFTVKITTWGDSKLYGLGGSWIAFTE